MTHSQTVICCLFMGTAISSPCFSSSAVAIVTAQGIVVGVDGKAVERCDTPCGPLNESKKIVLVQGRIALGTTGLHTVLGNPHVVPPYFFPSFVGHVMTRLGADATVSQVSETVKEEAAKVFSWFESYLRFRLVRSEDFPGEYPVEYVIAGYQGGAAKVYWVRVEVDWQRWRLKGVELVPMHPSGDQLRSRIYGAGSTRVLQQLMRRQGDLYQKVASRIPLEGRTLLDREELSFKEAGPLVRALLEVEAGANPDQVGPPFTIATIPKEGRPGLGID